MKFLLGLLPCLLFASFPTEEEMVRRIGSHLLIHDTPSALYLAKQALEAYPSSKALKILQVRALSRSGSEREAMRAWRSDEKLFEDPQEKRLLLEALAWGVLKKAEKSPQLRIRFTSLLGSSFTQDVRATQMLLTQMRSSNSFLRATAIKFSVKYRDELLKNEIKELFAKEKVWYVRHELLRAVGHLQIRELAPDLKKLIADNRAGAEEKGLAMEALVVMYDEIGDEELDHLLTSDRAGLRQFACEIISHLDRADRLPNLLALLDDCSPNVRIFALNTFGLLGGEKKELLPKLEKLTQDSHPQVAITAAWLMMRLGEDLSPVFKRWLYEEKEENRRFAAAALATAGDGAKELSFQVLQMTDDPYVAVNLALGMIGRRESVDLAAQALFHFLQKCPDKLMWDGSQNPLFRTLAPSKVRHIASVPQYPTAVDQITRLELLRILAILRYDKAGDLLKSLLKNRLWGVSGTAAMLLLEEGENEAVLLVQELLKDPDEKTRLQAALAVAMLGGGSEVSSILREAYPEVDRELKLGIIEALSKSHDPEVIPFLLSVLEEPFQVLRVAAASGIIQCLNH